MENNNNSGARMSLNSVKSLFCDSFKLYQERFTVLSEIALLPVLIMVLGYAFIFIGFPFSIIGELLILAGIIAFIFSTAALVFSVHNNSGVDDSYRQTTKFFWPIVWMSILSFFAFFGGMIMLIIPAIWLAIALALRNYTLLLENRKGIDALRQSKEYVKGYWWALCGRTALLVILFIIASIIIRIPFAIVGGVAGSLLGSLIFTLITLPFATIFYYKIYENLRSLKPELHGAQHASGGFIKVAAIVGLIIFVFAFVGLIFAAIHYAKDGDPSSSYSWGADTNSAQTNTWQYQPSNQ